VASSNPAADVAERAIAKLSVLMNIDASAEHARMVAAELADQGWTPEEVEAARRTIGNDAELMKQISYQGAVTPLVFVMAREKMAATRTLGPCFTFGCRNPATVAAWGDIYCAPCHSGHVARHKARDAALHRPKGQRADDIDPCRSLADILPSLAPEDE